MWLFVYGQTTRVGVKYTDVRFTTLKFKLVRVFYHMHWGILRSFKLTA